MSRCKMTNTLRGASYALLGTSLMLAASVVSAQDLAVPGKTPANPTLVLSVPNTSALWEGIKSSPVAGPLGKILEIENLVAKTDQERELVEKSLGISLDTNSLMTDVIAGVDVYFMSAGGYPGYLANIKFNDSAMPNKIMDQMKREASNASGISGGLSADSVAENTTNGVRTVYLPAFEIFLASDGDVLTYSSMRLGMESALGDEGHALFASEFFVRSMSHLEDLDGQLWTFGESTDAAPLLESLFSRSAAGSITAVAGQISSNMLKFEKDRVRISSFLHQDDMAMAEKRYAMTAPPAGDIPILNYVTDEALMVTATNHFDGLAILETSLTQLERMPNASGVATGLEEKLKSSSATLGFDLRNDVIANLGPNLGFALTKLDVMGEGGMLSPDFLLAASVKDTARFDKFLESARNTLTAMIPAPAGTEKDAAQAAPAAPAAEEFQGTQISSYTIPTGFGFDLEPSFTLTPDGNFLMTLNKDSLKQAITLGTGSGRSVLEAESMKALVSGLDPNRNSLLLVNVGDLTTRLEAPIGKALLTGNKLDDERRQAAFDILKKTRLFGNVTTYKANGKLNDIVILF